MIKRLLFFIFLAIFSLFINVKVYAGDFRSDYRVEYFLSQNQGNLNTRVSFNIKITNLRSDIYVSKFSISFPRNFIVRNLTAADDSGPITPKVTSDDLDTKIELEFREPRTGRSSENNFTLNFDQDNLFQINGNVWEVILPTVENKGDGTYKVIVNLPETSDRKISISKPKPDLVTGRQVIWNNPATKTIYAVFGESQFYQSELVYHISNPRLTPVYTDIAFPPDTLYQKIYFQSLSLKPDKVWRDEDGNFLGRYYLNPRESKTITLNLYVETMSQPRSEVKNYVDSLMSSGKKYLLSPQKYWQLSEANLARIQPYKSAADIYNFVTNSLKYNYKRLDQANIRLGADQVLTKPDQAVCVEFTDLFVAIAREKGIMTREIEGYGFTQDPQLRPISLTADILHSWPEYFDANSQLWIPIDPTWENTSGIDYFSSFDLNHIVFAIHGKRPDYPLPAGMYKFEKSRDILIKPTTVMPAEKIKLNIDGLNLPKNISDNRDYKINLVVRNDGNMYVWNVPVEFNVSGIKISQNKINIPVLAPYEKMEIPLTYSSTTKNKKSSGQLNVLINGSTVYNSSFVILPYYYDLAIKVSYTVIIISLLLLTFKFLRRKKVNDS